MALEKIGLLYVVDGSDSALADLKKLAKAEIDLSEGAKDAAQHTQSLGKTAAASAIGFASAELGLKALKAAFQFGLGNAIEFEHQIDAVGAVSGATEPELKALAGTAKQLGADTAFSAGEAAAAMQELAAGGRSVAQILGGEAKAAVDLAAAGGYGLADSARTIATTMAIWEDQQLDTNDVVNRLAGAANTSRFGVEDMSMAIAQGGGVAATAGVSFQDFSTAIAATASSFASGSDAGTSFKTFITSLSGSSEKAKDTIKELGLEFYTAQGTMKSMSEIVQELHDKLGPLSAEQQTVALKTIFGNDAFRTAASLMKLTGDEFSTMSQKMHDTSAADVAKQRMTNLSGSLEQLRGSAETLGIAFGEKVIPVLNEAVQHATSALNAFGALPGSTQNLTFAVIALGAAIPVMLQGLIKTVEMLIKLSEWSQTGAGKLTMVAVGLGAVLVAADALLQHFTGHSLMDYVFGDIAELEAREAAIRHIGNALYGVTDPAEKLAILQGQLASSAAEATKEQSALNYEMSTSEKIVFGTDGKFFGMTTTLFGFGDANKKAREEVARMKETVAAVGDEMIRAGTDVNTMKMEYDKLPPVLQKVFDAHTGVIEKYSLSQDAVEKEIFKIRESKEVHEEQAASIAEAQTALDVFNDGLAAEEAATGKAIDRTKEFNKALDALADRFAEANPQVIAAKGQLAAVDEELADLNRNGTNWSTTLGMTKDQLIALKKSLEDQVTAAEENQKATKGMRDELELYMNDGLINLQSHLASSKLSLEDQIDAEEGVAKALRALSKDDIPGFVSALGEVEKKAPGTAATVVSSLGPDLTMKLKQNIPELRATGTALADAMADGLEQGLHSAANRIVAAARGLARGATDAMAEEVQSHSPSKVTMQIGKDIADGLAIGIEDGSYTVGKAAAFTIDAMFKEMEYTLSSGKQYTGEELMGVFDYISQVMTDSNLPEKFQQMGFGMLQKWAQGIRDGTGVANTELLGFLDTLKTTIANNPVSIGGGGNTPSMLLGSDGKWYPNEGAMPAGVHGASTIPTVHQYQGGGMYEDIPMGGTKAAGSPGPNGTIWDPAAKAYVKPWDFGQFTPMKGWGSGSGLMMGQQLWTPSAVSMAQGGTFPSGGGNTQNIVIDLSGAHLTGTIAENEAMLRGIIQDELSDQTGRQAFLSGV